MRCLFGKREGSISGSVKIYIQIINQNFFYCIWPMDDEVLYRSWQAEASSGLNQIFFQQFA